MGAEVSYIRQHDEHVKRDRGFSASIVTVMGAIGSIHLEQCESCLHMTIVCLHSRNSWNLSGTVLTCDLCGVDGT